MPTPVRTEKEGSPPARSTFPGSWLDARDRRLAALGLGGAVLFAIFLGIGLIVLQRLDSGPPDPDAATLVIPPDYPRELTDFSLTDQSGRPVTRGDLRGRIVVVDFIFTSCSVTCPYVNAQMSRIQRATAGQPVRLLSITLDPTDDTVPVLASYAGSFGANLDRWSMLTGDAATVHRLVSTSFLPPDTTGEFAYMPGNFAHVQRIVLVDQTGHVACYFDGLNPNAADAAISAIKKLEATP